MVSSPIVGRLVMISAFYAFGSWALRREGLNASANEGLSAEEGEISAISKQGSAEGTMKARSNVSDRSAYYWWDCCMPGCWTWKRKAGDSTCGKLIEFKRKHENKTFGQARDEVAEAHPSSILGCGMCAEDCCDQGCHTWYRAVTGESGKWECGARIWWVQRHKKLSLEDAKHYVAQEFPDRKQGCGLCEKIQWYNPLTWYQRRRRSVISLF
eukprot:TRINITY_DN67122_c0_g1_i1.p1 TRINITY_DN67122_c0_g1~~TRINITY_DN67122_c0_g1_i1.p1  ORF type:complete len:239 (-),score=25.95 TRINITY_DN67122_c0_g1_i1:53-688(-)